MTIATVLARKGHEVATIASSASLRDVVASLGERRIGAPPVVDDAGVAGIISERDLIYALRDHGPDVLDWPVARIMSSPALTVASDLPILSALMMMTERRIRHLPVVEDGKLVGIVSIGDLVKRRMEQMEADAEAMLSYIQAG